MSKKRRIEAIVTVVLLLLCCAMLFASARNGQLGWASLFEKMAFAVLVALAVRWLLVLFETIPDSTDIYASGGGLDVRTAVKDATERIWILQTWLPGTQHDANLILGSCARDVRILLASFASESPIFARIRARPDIDGDENGTETAKSNSASSAFRFWADGRQDCVRFTAHHQPGWIAVIDDQVFWGFTPVEDDNWSVPAFSHRAPKHDYRAKRWQEEFLLLWEGVTKVTRTRLSHSFDHEMQFNEKLRRCRNM